MKQEIKNRIKDINNGIMPSGYEKTEFGIFPCDWVKDKTFGDLFDFYGGLGKSRDELGDEGHAYLHYGDLHRGSFNVVSHAQYEHLPKYDVTLKGSEAYLMEDGDVAFLDASEDLEGTSRSVLIDNPDNEPFIAGLHVIFGKSKNNSLEKWYKQYITATDSVRKQFQRLASGFKVYGVTRETLPKIQIAYPKSTDEQSKIAEILMKWDEAIELYNQQIEKLKQLKSICLKKMFPQKGERVPEWRFKGFSDAWEQRKAKELCNIGTGKSNTQDQVEDGTYPFYIRSDIPVKSNKYLYDCEAVITIGDGNIGRVFHYVNGKFDLHQRCYKMTDFQDIWGKYFYYFFSTRFYDRAMKMTAKATVDSVRLEMISEMDILKPMQIAEQRKIAEFFTNLDNLITLHQCKVEKIKAQQKVLQKYLLNGIVRV